MTRNLCRIVMFSALALCSAVFTLPAPAQTIPEDAGKATASNWLALIDAAKYSTSWEEASSVFRGAVTKEQWERAMHASRDPLGKVVSRKLKSAVYTRTLPGAPEGEYVVAQFDTGFEHKAASLETVTCMLDRDGNWRVSGYFIK